MKEAIAYYQQASDWENQLKAIAATGLKPGNAKKTARPPIARALKTERITNSLACGFLPSNIKKKGSMVSKIINKEITIYRRPPEIIRPAKIVKGIANKDKTNVAFVLLFNFPFIKRCSRTGALLLAHAANIPNKTNIKIYTQPYPSINPVPLYN